MKFSWLNSELEKIELKVARITFLEDGYEIRIKANPKYSDECRAKSDFVRDKINGMDIIEYNGFVALEPDIVGGMCTVMLVPKSMEEMTDFIWKYVERYGKKENRLVDILADAFCVLEKAIERIPDDKKYSKAKKEAQDNYNSFTQMIF